MNPNQRTYYLYNIEAKQLFQHNVVFETDEILLPWTETCERAFSECSV